METEIEILKKYYGSYTKAAKALGITYQHLVNIRNGEHIGRYLAEFIKNRVNEIKNIDSDFQGEK